MSDSYKIYASQEYVDAKVPNAPGAHRQLVTDADGNAQWGDNPFNEVTAENVFAYGEWTLLATSTADGSGIISNAAIGYTVDGRTPIFHKDSYFIVTANEYVFRLNCNEIDIGISQKSIEIGSVDGYPVDLIIIPSIRGTIGFNARISFTLEGKPNKDVNFTVSYIVPSTKTELPETFIPTTIPRAETASVGQVIAVKAVDENGKPTEWEAVDMGGGITEEQVNALIESYVDNAILGGEW